MSGSIYFFYITEIDRTLNYLFFLIMENMIFHISSCVNANSIIAIWIFLLYNLRKPGNKEKNNQNSSIFLFCVTMISYNIMPAFYKWTWRYILTNYDGILRKTIKIGCDGHSIQKRCGLGTDKSEQTINCCSHTSGYKLRISPGNKNRIT